MNSYTYILIDPITDLPFYVGKGKGNRAKYHIKLTGEASSPKDIKINELLSKGLFPKIEYVVDSVSDDVARKYECILISILGRADICTGLLLNRSSGGEGAIPTHRRIIKYNLFGEKLDEFDSLLDAAASINRSPTGIYSCCIKRKHCKTCGGYAWSFEGEPLDLSFVHGKKRPIYQWDLDGNYINRYEYPALIPKEIRAAACSVRDSFRISGGFYWTSGLKPDVQTLKIERYNSRVSSRTISHPTKVIDLNTGNIYDSIYIAGAELDANPQSIRESCIRNRDPHPTLGKHSRTDSINCRWIYD